MIMNVTDPMDHCAPKVNLRSGFRWRLRSAVGVTAVWLLMTLAGGGSARAVDEGATKAKPKDRVVAKVNGMPIFASDLNAMIKAEERMLRQQLANDPARLAKELAEVEGKALNGLIDFQLLGDEFFRLGGMISEEAIDDDVKQATQETFQGSSAALYAELDAIGMTYDRYRALREKILMAGAVRARIFNNVEVTEAMVREHYEQNLQRWRDPESVKFHTLTIFNTTANAREVAESLRTRLLNGGDFAEMARESSKDSRAADGGAWPWTRISDINDSVGKTIEKMKKGELSEVLEQPGTFILLRVDDVRESDAKPFESVKAQVRKSLIEKLGRERMEDRLCRLREAADIRRLGPV